MTAGRISGLDGVRALAIALVFAAHSIDLPSGWLGVQLFFVLSGYLITPILLDMREGNGGRYFVSFWGRRALRIFPACYVYLLAMLPLCFAAIEWTGWRFAALQRFEDQVLYAALYVYNFFHASSAFEETSFLTHFWSLAVEEQVYLTWPVLIALAGRRRIVPVLIALACAGPFFRGATWLAGSHFGVEWLNADLPLAIYVLPWSHLDAFAIGGLAALLPATASRRMVATVWGVIAVAGFASEVAATGEVGPIEALGYGLAMPHAYKFVWGYSLLNLGFALMIQQVERRSWGHGVFEFPPVRYLGRISYGVYIWHFPVIFLVQATFIDRGWESGPLPLVLLSFVATVAIAGASYRWIETPLLARKDTWFPRTG
ncbi:MAG: acyltransferase [Myxococcota bacterium]|nr:acyltransferase [Myxococcota bacterium]